MILLTRQQALSDTYWQVKPYRPGNQDNKFEEITQKYIKLENGLLDSYSRIQSLENTISELSVAQIQDYPPFPYSEEQLKTEFEYIDTTLDIFHKWFGDLNDHFTKLSNDVESLKLSVVTKESYTKLLDIFDKYREMLRDRLHEYYD